MKPHAQNGSAGKWRRRWQRQHNRTTRRCQVIFSYANSERHRCNRQRLQLAEDYSPWFPAGRAWLSGDYNIQLLKNNKKLLDYFFDQTVKNFRIQVCCIVSTVLRQQHRSDKPHQKNESRKFTPERLAPANLQCFRFNTSLILNQSQRNAHGLWLCDLIIMSLVLDAAEQLPSTRPAPALRPSHYKKTDILTTKN